MCQNVVDEFLSAIHKIDPKKMVDTGTFRIDAEGKQQRSIVRKDAETKCKKGNQLQLFFSFFNSRQIPYARSQQHLMELVDKICANFEDYVQVCDRPGDAERISAYVSYLCSPLLLSYVYFCNLQGKWKSDGSPTVIRLTTPEGNMNPRFGEVELVPDDDLNTKLKFYVRTASEGPVGYYYYFFLTNSFPASVKRSWRTWRRTLPSFLRRRRTTTS